MLAHKANIAILLTLSAATVINGISDLEGLAFCALQGIIGPSVWASIGGALAMQLALVQGVESLKIWLWWVARKVRKGKGESVGVRVLDGNKLQIDKKNNLDNEKERPIMTTGKPYIDNSNGNERSIFRVCV